MVVSEPLTAILGSQCRDRPRHVANRTTSAADMIVVVGPRRRKGVRASLPAAINLTGNIDGMCLGHGRADLSRREHNRSLSHRRKDQMPMIGLRWGIQTQIASFNCVKT
jgi:hypothetical protein